MAGISLVGVGVAGLVVGSIFGLDTFSKKDESFDHCEGTACDPDGAALRDDARTSATVSTIAFAVGAVAVAGGVILALTAGSADARRSAAKLGPRSLRFAW